MPYRCGYNCIFGKPCVLSIKGRRRTKYRKIKSKGFLGSDSNGDKQGDLGI